MSVRDRYQLVIGGSLQEPADGCYLTSENPATGEPLAEIAAGTEADIDRAVGEALDAFDSWKQRPPAERGRLLHALADRIRAEKTRLAELEVLDNGKPLSQAKGDVEGCARYFEYYAGAADKIHGESIPLTRDYVDYTVREPYGVTGQIIPWNFPINLVGRTVAPALASGNVSVMKPAEQTSITAVEVALLADEVGIPPGVMNVVTGFGDEAGSPLVGHPDVGVVSFTGSVPTGKHVAKVAAESVTPVHLELGGKNPFVVFEDADVGYAVDNALTAAFNVASGQVCSAGTRLLVQESIYDEFTSRLAEQVEELTIGPGMEDPDVGPLISETQFEQVTGYLDVGREEGGEILAGGGVPNRDGYFVEPTLFSEVSSDARIAQEEIFGPVLTALPFAGEDHAVELANDIEYGLVAGVFTDDIGRANRFARDVTAGQVYINEWFAGGVETPFGGTKNSGYGREKGLEAIRGYTRVKNVCANIARDPDAGGK